MSLKNKLTSLLSDLKRMCNACSEAIDLENEIQQLEERIDKPLRVAIVGIMKAGKSTFMNALMGENLLYTGTEETTYTVTWFKYSSKPYLNIVFKDNRCQSEKALFEELEKWTVRKKSADNPKINDVKYIEVYYPNETLKTIELIDTPGLNSSYNLDSQNTLDFLGVKNKEEANKLEQTTKDEVSKADAIIYAFTRSAGSTDRDILNEFHGNALTSSTSPINALGVYTKADLLWKVLNAETPLELGWKVTNATMENPVMKKLLYSVIPVVAKIVEGFALLTENDWNALEKLAKIDKNTLNYEMRNITTFTKKEPSDFGVNVNEMIGAPEQRLSLVTKIGTYGIFEITNCINMRYNKNEIKAHIYKTSGIGKINELIVSHFGNRSFIIKTQYIFLRLKHICSELQKETMHFSLQTIVGSILERIKEIETNEHVFRELKVLQDFYNGLFSFNTEAEYQEFLQVTGEKGKNCESKLGVNKPTPVSEMAEIAKMKAVEWNGKANECGISRIYEDAARVIARSYDILYDHLSIMSGE